MKSEPIWLLWLMGGCLAAGGLLIAVAGMATGFPPVWVFGFVCAAGGVGVLRMTRG